jgi:hypothetical protein
MFSQMTPYELAGQVVGLIALAFCIAGFSSKQDDRLMVLLISANVAFALQYALFQSWTAAALSALVIVRIGLARRYQGSLLAMCGVLGAGFVAAALTWQSLTDLFPLTAMVLGTVGMFLLRGIPMRLFLAAAATAWMLNNIVIGSIGASLAEGLVIITNFITIIRLKRMQHRYATIDVERE